MFRRKLKYRIMVLSCLFLLYSYYAWASTPLEVTGANEFSNDFFWRIIGALCTVIVLYSTYQMKRKDKRDDERDNLLKGIAQTIWGSETHEGLTSRISVMENVIDRCPGCTPGYHKREGDQDSHIHLRKGVHK